MKLCCMWLGSEVKLVPSDGQWVQSWLSSRWEWTEGVTGDYDVVRDRMEQDCKRIVPKYWVQEDQTDVPGTTMFSWVSGGGGGLDTGMYVVNIRYKGLHLRSLGIVTLCFNEVRAGLVSRGHREIGRVRGKHSIVFYRPGLKMNETVPSLGSCLILSITKHCLHHLVCICSAGLEMLIHAFIFRFQNSNAIILRSLKPTLPES